MRARSIAILSVALAAAGCGGSPSAPAPSAESLWSAPLTLPSPAPPAAAHVAERDDGTAIAVWAQQGKGPAARPMAAERAADGTWAPGEPIAPESPTPIRSVCVVVGDDGAVTAVWALDDRSVGAVFSYIQSARREPGGEWGEPVTLSRGTNGLSEVLATGTSDGRVVVVWAGSERRNGSYFAEMKSAERAADGQWSFARIAGIRLGDPFLPAGALASDPSGVARLVWLALPRRGFKGGVLASDLTPGGRWSTPRVLAGSSGNQSDLRVASATDGTMTAAWRRPRDGVLTVTRRGASGWSAARVVPGGGTEPNAVVSEGGAGGSLVVLERTRPAARRSTLLAVRVGADGSLSRLVPLASQRVPPSSRLGVIAWEATAVVSEEGRAAVAWPRFEERPDGVLLTRAIVARVSGPSGPWTREQAVAPGALGPGLGVFPQLFLEDSRFQLRWTSEGPDGGTRVSTRRR